MINEQPVLDNSPIDERITLRAHHMDTMERYKSKLEEKGFLVTREGIKFTDGNLLPATDESLLETMKVVYQEELNFRKDVALRQKSQIIAEIQKLSSLGDEETVHINITNAGIFAVLLAEAPELSDIDIPIFIQTANQRAGSVNPEFRSNEDLKRRFVQTIKKDPELVIDKVLGSFELGYGYFQDAYQIITESNDPDFDRISALNNLASDVAVKSILTILAAPANVMCRIGFTADGICEAACVIGGKHCGNVQLGDAIPMGRDRVDMQQLEKYLTANEVKYEIEGDKETVYYVYTTIGDVREFMFKRYQ